jgi:hypothetical protein
VPISEVLNGLIQDFRQALTVALIGIVGAGSCYHVVRVIHGHLGKVIHLACLARLVADAAVWDAGNTVSDLDIALAVYFEDLYNTSYKPKNL